MDSTLVVFYSYTGVTRRAARLLASQHDFALGEVTDVEPRATWRCVFDSLLRRHPPIRYEGPDPGRFRNVVLMTPVWAYRLAGPMRTFATQYREKLPRAGVICTMNSGGAPNVFRELSHILGHGLIRAGAFTAGGIEDGTATADLVDFGSRLDERPVPQPTVHHFPSVLPMD
ncbi:flavodoxin [Ramlibacter sp. XY19]|uniref:flavodoxin family protein n=1 Tax=Ramlibacter paludis TaxID=2908000 RepID=UPI0023DB4D9C|nr:flavodoxin [Ramlibacter paludis]MCG2594400.1 flavodoxin [Ramlibacter paludis]